MAFRQRIMALNCAVQINCFRVYINYIIYPLLIPASISVPSPTTKHSQQWNKL